MCDGRSANRRTNRKEKRGRGRRRRCKKKELARARVREKKKRGEFVTLIGETSGYAGRWTRIPSWTEGVRIQDSGKTRGRNRGTRRVWKKRNEPCGAWKESCKFFFFFPHKKGPRMRGATVGRRIDRSGSENRGETGAKGGGKDARVVRGILTLFGRSTFINLYPGEKNAHAHVPFESPGLLLIVVGFFARKHLHAFGGGGGGRRGHVQPIQKRQVSLSANRSRIDSTRIPSLTTSRRKNRERKRAWLVSSYSIVDRPA